MNWLDIVIAILLVISIIGGLKAGIIKVLFTIAGLIIGVVLAGNYSGSLAERLGFISDARVANIVAFILIMLVVSVIAAVLAFVIKKIASAVLLGWVNHLGGAVLGLILGMIFAGALLTMWLKFSGDNSTITGSWLAAFLVNKFPIVMGFLPSQFDSVKGFFK
jgi:membrane protein required for colicin V production